MAWVIDMDVICPCCRQQEWAADIAQQLDPDKHTIVLCHHGMRSNMVRSAPAWLRHGVCRLSFVQVHHSRVCCMG